MRKNLDGGLLHAMHAFLKVIDSGSFTAAAEQMELTTAQVSRLISELEGRLGTKLLQRSTRQHALTDIGAAYAEQCRQDSQWWKKQKLKPWEWQANRRASYVF